MSQMSIPGKLLVIDDRFEDVQPLLTELTRYGVPIVYWNPNSPSKPSTTNVRVVLTDINLLGLDIVTKESYEDLAAKVKDVSGPFILLFVSVHFNEDSPSLLSEAYHDVTGKQLPGIVVGVNFDKTQAREVLAEVPDKIREILSRHELFSALLLAESVLNQGADSVLSEFTRQEFETTIRALIKSIVDDTGEESAAREFVMLLSRLLTRNISSSTSYPGLKTTLNALVASGSMTASPSLEASIYNKRMYYAPDRGEDYWTGDIFETDSADPFRKFAILITPSCDIAQDKVGYYKFCYGVIATETGLQEYPSHPIYTMDKSLKNPNEAVQRYLHKKGSFPRLYPLNHFLDDSGDDSRTLVIDFQLVESITPTDLSTKTWNRIYRLDSPFTEDLLQKYGAHSFRLGSPTVTE